MPRPRIVIVHDWLVGLRGGERVLDELLSVLPEARVHALFHRPGTLPDRIERRVAETSPLQPLARRLGSRYRWLLPLCPWAVSRIGPGEVDLVVSVSHCVAHAVPVPPGVPHIAYVLTPMRYVWDRMDAYLEGAGPLAGLGLRAVAPLLRRWERSVRGNGAGGRTRLVTISAFVRERIRRAWGVGADIVHPPVAWDRFSPGEGDGGYDLVVSALVAGKGLGLLVDAYRGSGRKLLVCGKGPLRAELEARAGPGTRFLGRVPDEALPDLYRRAEVCCFPGVEEFGIVPVEAMASGRPVLARAAGGALETVVPDGPAPTGHLFERPTVRAVRRAREAMARRMARGAYRPEAIREHARRFRSGAFRRAFRDRVDDALPDGRGRAS